MARQVRLNPDRPKVRILGSPATRDIDGTWDQDGRVFDGDGVLMRYNDGPAGDRAKIEDSNLSRVTPPTPPPPTPTSDEAVATATAELRATLKAKHSIALKKMVEQYDGVEPATGSGSKAKNIEILIGLATPPPTE